MDDMEIFMRMRSSAWYSTDDLSRQLHIDRRHAANALRRLQRAGLIEIGAGRRYRTKQMELCFGMEVDTVQ